eukprot:7156705-Lingulodinium_polyedra.AAC.1
MASPCALPRSTQRWAMRNVFASTQPTQRRPRSDPFAAVRATVRGNSVAGPWQFHAKSVAFCVCAWQRHGKQFNGNLQLGVATVRRR